MVFVPDNEIEYQIYSETYESNPIWAKRVQRAIAVLWKLMK